MRKTSLAFLGVLSMIMLAGCGLQATQSNDSKIAEQQEQQQAEGNAEVPPPAITNWNEKRLLKAVMERRDQTNLSTWTYTKNMDGKYTWICESIGYGIPYNTRANNPQHYEFMSTRTGVAYSGSGYYTDGQGNTIWGEHAIVAQAEPNGLFIPESAKGTWNTCRDPHTGKPAITYQEEDIAVFPYRLPDGMVEGFHPAPLPPVSEDEVSKVVPPLTSPPAQPRPTASAPSGDVGTSK